MKVHVYAYYTDPTEGLIVALKGDLEGMFTIPAIGHRIQVFYDRGHDITALIEIYDQMNTMIHYGLPDISDDHDGKIRSVTKPAIGALDLFTQHVTTRQSV